jgi:type VI secretion system protein ImpH
MADQNRGAVSSLIQDIFEKPTSYSFFQAVRLLRLIENKTSGPALEDFFQNELRVRPHLSLSFPANDMTEIALSDDEGARRLHITATFLGLYGTGSPLPTFYTEELLDESSDDRTVCRDFLDIFNSPFYAYFFKAWTKYRLQIKSLDERDASYLDKLFCLLGLGHEELKSHFAHPVRGLRYIGLFSQFPRSAMGLRTLLADMLENPSVDVIQCRHRQVKIPQDQRCLLGERGVTLGDDAWLGEEFPDRTGKILITVRDMDEATFHAHLPGTESFGAALRMINYYLVAPLEYDLSFTLAPEEVKTTQPGNEKWSQLGLDTWVFSGDRLEEATAVFQGKASLATPTATARNRQ